jgi:hypothetical protein
MPYLRKRSGHTLSKGRFLGAQMTAYLENGRTLDLAAVANAHARDLAHGLAKIPGVRMPWPCEANEIFVILPRSTDAALRAGARSTTLGNLVISVLAANHRPGTRFSSGWLPRLQRSLTTSKTSWSLRQAPVVEHRSGNPPALPKNGSIRGFKNQKRAPLARRPDNHRAREGSRPASAVTPPYPLRPLAWRPRL